jgi:lipopolysaccharide transport system ATP-binding protein
MIPAIHVEKLSKHYELGSRTGNGYRMLRDVIADAAAAPFRRLRTLNSATCARPSGSRNFEALRDVSFRVEPGEVVGIIGRNGAGKSTLLKILSRITEPSSGRVELRGRVGSLLEVGTGFHPELSGRENVYLNGAILGMTRREINAKFDDIAAFAEIDEFLDTPVKRYSSGMHVRLAFAVAAHLEPEILLVDEVLAVGDAVFQRKCLGKMNDVAQKGRTVLFVSHNMGAMTRLCTRGVWLERGQLRLDGDIEQVVSSYLANDTHCDGEIAFQSDSSAPGSSDVRLCAVRVVNQEGRITSSLDARHPFHIEVEYEVLRELSDLRIGMRLVTHDGTAIVTSTDGDESGHEFVRTPGKYVSRCTVPGCFLNYGQYFIAVGSDFPLRKVHFSLDPALSIQVEHTGGVGGHILDGRKGILRVQLPWARTVLGSYHCQSNAIDSN